MTVAPGWALPLLGATSKSSSGSSIYLIFIIIGAAFYFLIYRPQQKKAKALREQSNAFEVGDEVLTAGGIVGHVIDIDGDRVTLETSVGASFVVLKQYVLRKLEDPTASGIDEDDGFDDDEHDDSDENEDHGSDHADADGDADDEGDDDDHGDPSADGEHPAGRGGKPGNVTKAEGGDEPTGTDGPSII